MSIERLEHYSVRTADVAAVIDFYGAVLGLVPGPRPDFPFPGAWLYRADAAQRTTGYSVVHVIGTGIEQAGGLDDFLGAKHGRAHEGTGLLDHIAFRASGIAAMYALLKDRGLAFRERRVPGLDLHLLFLEDPSGVTIELNYTSEADLAAAAGAS